MGTGTAMRIELKYVIEDTDRHGNVRLYVRVPGKKKIRIRERPGTALFMDAYKEAVAGATEALPQHKPSKRGSFRHLCQLYMSASNVEWMRLDPDTRNWQRRALDHICQTHADKPVALMTSKHVKRLRDELKDTPSQSQKLLKALRAMFAWANEAEEADNNPTIGVKAIKFMTEGHHAWTLSEVEQFECRHAIGSKARLAMGLLLYTSWRREDAVRLGTQHIVEVRKPDGSTEKRIRYRQAKNEHRNPVDMDVPLHPDLAELIEATPSGHLTFLVTAHGKPFTPAGFGNWFRDRCNEANLPHCSAHGLRKATASRLAERGASAHQIMAWTGLRTLTEAERYTRAARQAKLADDALAKLK
jgi:integrase/recombinase XerD